jgi:cysteine desulfurase
MRQLYFDYNATTPSAPSVREAMLPFLSEHFGNPSSAHSFGRACQEAIEDARGQVANLLGCDAEELVFTSGGTESNNLALQGVMLLGGLGTGGHLVITAFEHPSVSRMADFLERLGLDVTIVSVTRNGLVEPDEVRSALRSDTRLVSVMHANNEIGTIQPLREIAQVCHEQNVLLHADAAQSAGKIRTLVDELEVDLLTIAGHKMYAPKGVGAQYIRRGIHLEPVLHGGGQESGIRAGTENVASIVALGKAAQLAAHDLDGNVDRLTDLRDRLWNELLRGIGEELLMYGKKSPRLPNTLSVSFPHVAGHEILSRLPELAASTGSACHSETEAISPTLAALEIPTERARGTIRLSLGWYTSEEDIDRAASLLIGAWEALQ